MTFTKISSHLVALRNNVQILQPSALSRRTSRNTLANASENGSRGGPIVQSSKISGPCWEFPEFPWAGSSPDPRGWPNHVSEGAHIALFRAADTSHIRCASTTLTMTRKEELIFFMNKLWILDDWFICFCTFELNFAKNTLWPNEKFKVTLNCWVFLWRPRAAQTLWFLLWFTNEINSNGVVWLRKLMDGIR